MWKVVVRRLILAIPTLFVVATVTFFLVKLVPGDPANLILGHGATAAQIAVVHKRLGLDQPVVLQYLAWISHIVRGDLGTSYVSGNSVASSIGLALPTTLSLAVIATFAALIAGLLVGMLVAIRRGRLDTAAQGVASLGLAIPNFWVAALLIFVLAVTIPLFPATGYTPFTTDPVAWALGLALPATAIAINNFCQIVLQARSSVLDVLSRDFIRSLQAAGISRRRLLFKHVLRNAAIPVSTVTGITFIGTLGGVVVIESIFAMPGMGNLLLSSVQSGDTPTVEGTVLVFAVMVVAVNLVIDVLNAWLDPRTRLS